MSRKKRKELPKDEGEGSWMEFAAKVNKFVRENNLESKRSWRKEIYEAGAAFRGMTHAARSNVYLERWLDAKKERDALRAS